MVGRDNPVPRAIAAIFRPSDLGRTVEATCSAVTLIRRPAPEPPHRIPRIGRSGFAAGWGERSG